MDRWLLNLSVFAALIGASPAVAQNHNRQFEGTWIWDRDLYVPAPNARYTNPMVAETMSVERDDGSHYKGSIVQVFSDGRKSRLSEEFAEDGRFYPIVSAPWMGQVGIVELPDGGRRVFVRFSGGMHDTRCHVSADGDTMTCHGIETKADGSVGADVCVYHRDPRGVPVASSGREEAVLF